MIKQYKMVALKYDDTVAPNLMRSGIHATRGNDLRIQESSFGYDSA